MRTKTLKLTVIFAVICIVNSTSFGADVQRKVVFPKGKSIVTYSGKLPGGTRDAYTISLRKGQRVTVTLNTKIAKAYFHVYELNKLGPNEDQIFAGDFETRQFSGVAPVTSSYAIQIYDGNDSPTRAPYTVTISVMNN
jgi:hypothetical protein